MDWHERRINQEIKRIDRDLFVGRDPNGTLQILRKGYTTKAYQVDGCTIYALEPMPRYIMSLTEDWTNRTKPVEWGLEPIVRRLQEIDSWNANSLTNNMLKINEKVDQSKERDKMSKLEDAVRESHHVYKKTFSDINTSTMDRKNDPRRKKESKKWQ